MHRAPDAVYNRSAPPSSNSCSDHALIRVYDEAGNVVETHEHTRDFKEP